MLCTAKGSHQYHLGTIISLVPANANFGLVSSDALVHNMASSNKMCFADKIELSNAIRCTASQHTSDGQEAGNNDNASMKINADTPHIHNDSNVPNGRKDEDENGSEDEINYS